jgi:hypothetical protein
MLLALEAMLLMVDVLLAGTEGIVKFLKCTTCISDRNFHYKEIVVNIYGTNLHVITKKMVVVSTRSIYIHTHPKKICMKLCVYLSQLICCL